MNLSLNQTGCYEKGAKILWFFSFSLVMCMASNEPMKCCISALYFKDVRQKMTRCRWCSYGPSSLLISFIAAFKSHQWKTKTFAEKANYTPIRNRWLTLNSERWGPEVHFLIPCPFLKGETTLASVVFETSTFKWSFFSPFELLSVIAMDHKLHKSESKDHTIRAHTIQSTILWY